MSIATRNLIPASDFTESVKVGLPAPNFTLWSEQNKEWRLSDQIGNVVVLLFYPQNETLVCTKQLCSVRDNWGKYLETRAEIVGISPGTPEQHQTFSNSRHLPMRLLADPDRRVTAVFGQHWLLPLCLMRTVVVIDSKGIVRNRDVMLRAFRPSDAQLLTDIYAARGDAFNEMFKQLADRSPNKPAAR